MLCCRPRRKATRRRWSEALVEGDDAGAAQADVVLQAEPRALDLARAGLTAELPDELRALREAGRAQRVPLGQQPAGGVRHDAAAVGVVAVHDELLGRALRRQPERLVAQQLVRREAVVQLDD